MPCLRRVLWRVRLCRLVVRSVPQQRLGGCSLACASMRQPNLSDNTALLGRVKAEAKGSASAASLSRSEGQFANKGTFPEVLVDGGVLVFRNTPVHALGALVQERASRSSESHPLGGFFPCHWGVLSSCFVVRVGSFDDHTRFPFVQVSDIVIGR